MKVWSVGDGIPARTEPGNGYVVFKLRKYEVLELVAESYALLNGLLVKFYCVVRLDGEKAISQGWVYSGYVEPYQAEFTKTVLKIKNKTPNPNDAEQYLIWHGQAQYNLCGYFAVCYCAGWDANVEDFLDLLKQKKLSLITRRFPAWQSRGTNIYDLDIMLSLFDYKLPSRQISELLFDPIADRMVVTPGRFAEILKDNRIIYSVKLDVSSGRLARSGVLHWVVLEKFEPEEYQGRFLLYNPFPNKPQRYDWSQVIDSGGVPYGIVVPR